MTGARGITAGRLAALVVLVLAVAVVATLLITRATDGSGAGGRDGESKGETGDGRPSRASSKGATPGPTGGTPYAYTTEQELVLVRGDRPPTRVPRVFDLADPHRNMVVWTHDGHRVAFFSDDELLDRREDTRLITVDARTGEVRRLPCPGCHDLTPVGDHDVMVLSYEPGPTSAFRIDLDRPTTPRTELDNGSYWQPQLLGATPTHVLTGQYEMSGGDPGMALRLNDLNTAGITVYPRFESNATCRPRSPSSGAASESRWRPATTPAAAPRPSRSTSSGRRARSAAPTSRPLCRPDTSPASLAGSA
ncbi:hypothetical protein GCM10010425_50470 [Streptomyces spororaveus]|uniref:Uncharacterized protein n=1 Tax=Streptomyces spororaveus TaxID=284039 RepID=A0ABQ3T2N0_9ACTN|nr:hypothetical protein [Streptomyces spororaveus]GHI74641.1 hypothetical protein Sspor_02020 [Streptomyces spororaveus]